MQKIPYIAVVGEREKEANSVAVRARGNKDLGTMTIDKFIELIKTDVVERK
jgi:threonyl-tRNA synthetase